jgi:hypothetical protein
MASAIFFWQSLIKSEKAPFDVIVFETSTPNETGSSEIHRLKSFSSPSHVENLIQMHKLARGK